MVHLLKDVNKSMTVMKREMENINNNQMEHLGMKNTVSEVQFL